MKNIDNALMYCYTELYKNAEPSADFQILMDNAFIDENGHKNIDCMAYEISDSKMDEIISETIKMFKIPKFYRGGFKTMIYLGCSPKSKRN
jgi:hypothetical protein